jgi:tetratricopeptide (TPR) repeat protein
LLHRLLIALTDHVHGIESAQVRARSRAGLAGLLRLRGCYREAEREYLKGLADAKSTLGEEDPSMVPLLSGLGIVYKYTGQFDPAERVYYRALSLTEGHGRVNLNQLADLYHNLGGLDHARGHFAHGEPLARRAVDLRIQALGEEHASVAADRAALAALLDGLGRNDEAEFLLRHAVRVLERIAGPNHGDVAAALNNLAAIRQKRGATDEAERLYRRALAIKERLNGADHPELTPTLNNLATLLRRRGQVDEAAALYQRALKILERTVEPDHPNLLACRANYTALLHPADR